MNKEINKIIDNLEGCIGMFDYLLTPVENNLLVSYIKELQQENQKLKDKNTIYKSTIKGQYNKIKELQNAKRISKEVHKKRNKKLQEENEKLNHYKLLYQKVKERNDKAIEYIDSWVYDEYSISIQDGENSCHYDDKAIDTLLEILKGNNEEK